MTDEHPRPEPPRTPAASRRYKPHAVGLTDGGQLVLGVDGSIRHVDEHGSNVHVWMTDDPAWPDQAFRFGLHPQAPTVTPQGRHVPGTKPPR